MCLSPCVSMDRSQEINKPFVSETKSLRVFVLNMYMYSHKYACMHATEKVRERERELGKSMLAARHDADDDDDDDDDKLDYHDQKILRIWTRRHEFKSWTILIAFHIALIPLGKVWIQLFSLQLWINSRTD